VPRVAIDVMLREEILDPQGQAVERALPGLGFPGVSGVRIGKHIVVELPAGIDATQLAAQVEALAAKLLANPVLERFTWRVEA